MSDKPKTFGEAIRERYLGGRFPSKAQQFTAEYFWNAATEAARAENEEKIKAMQAEIDKLKKKYNNMLKHGYNCGGSVGREPVNECCGGCPACELMQRVYSDNKELNQRGEDE